MHGTRRTAYLWAIVVCGLVPLAGNPAVAEERGTGPVRLDVFVQGPDETVAGLSAGDFAVELGGSKVTDLVAERLPDAADEASPKGNPRLRMVPTDFVFYLQGVQPSENGVPIRAAGLVEALITGSNRGMIITDDLELSMIQDFTADPERLLAALRQVKMIEGDRLSRTLANATVEKNDRSARRLTLLMDRLALLDPPRVLIHIGPRTRYSDPSLGTAVVRAANRNLVRIYHFPNNDIPYSAGRRAAAHVGLAKPTGGRSFSNTEPVAKVADRIARDLQSCFLLSFDPSGFARDKFHPIFVQTGARKISVSTRRELFLPSESPEKAHAPISASP